MRVIRPAAITPADLIYSSVAEDEYPTWSALTGYVVGNTVIYEHIIYECLIDNSNTQPDLNTGGTTPKWLNLGYTNRWKMFDNKVGSKTTDTGSVTVTVAPGLIDSIAILDVTATTINVVMEDPIEGVVFTETVDLVNGSTIVDGYSYFFEPILTDDAAVLLGIPPYTNAQITFTFNYGGGEVSIGTLTLGIQKSLGLTLYNPSISITDYSKKTTDIFGNYTVLERAFSKKLSCDINLPSSQVDDLQRTLAEYRATPVIWVGADRGYSSMIIYGFYKSFTINIPYSTVSSCTLEIEGLA